MKNIVKKLLVVAALSCAGSGSLAAAQAPAAQAPAVRIINFPEWSPFLTECYNGLAIDETIFSRNYNGFFNLVLQLHYHWLKNGLRLNQQLLGEYDQASDAKKTELLKLWQASSDGAFKEFLKTAEGRAFLAHYAPRHGWQNDLDKVGVLQLPGAIHPVVIVAWTALSRDANLAINSQKLDLYNPEVRKAGLARLPARAPQPAPVATPAQVAALNASGEINDPRCGVIARRSGNGFVGGIIIPDGDDIDAIKAAIADDFETEISQPSMMEYDDEPAAKRFRSGGHDDDEKKAN